MEADGLHKLPAELEGVLRKQWLGKPTEPDTPARIASNLGYDLFVTKGLKATPWESFKSALRQEGAKQLATLVGGVLLAALVVTLVSMERPAPVRIYVGHPH
jgi:hypothetical protein